MSLSNSLSLARQSWDVVKSDKELLLLPVMSAIASIVVAASIVTPVFISAGESIDDVSLGPVQYVMLFVMYIALAYITIFFNAALIHAANERMEGGDPTLGSALRGAASRAGTILPWAIVSATVSIVLRAIAERAGFLGQIVVGLVGLAWTLVTYLVLPILVVERMSVGDAIRESTSLFKRTWGENVTAQFGFGLIAFLAMLPVAAVIALSVAAGGAVAVVGVSVAVAAAILVAVVIATLSGIYQTALYRYARTGSTGGGFDDAMLGQAFRPKRQRRGIV